MAVNTGKGWRQGQVKDRYQVYNERTDKYDKFDGDGNYMQTKQGGEPFKGVEIRDGKHPRRR